jgi:hypothetical protein
MVHSNLGLNPDNGFGECTIRSLARGTLQKVIAIIVLLAKSYIMTEFSHDKSPEDPQCPKV